MQSIGNVTKKVKKKLQAVKKKQFNFLVNNIQDILNKKIFI